MRILAISDTHGFHSEFKEKDFEKIDMVIHAGDFSQSKNALINSVEAQDFLEWYEKLPVKYKVLISGNHETSVEAHLVNPRDYKSIIYLEHDDIEIEGINIFGSPYSPEFFSWAYNVRRDRLGAYWESIPENTDILVTHTPPKGMLDLSYDMNNRLEYCGCAALLKHIKRIKPRYNIFGHIHNNDSNYNAGRRTTSFIDTEFINASCVTDGQFSKGLTSKGLIINYLT